MTNEHLTPVKNVENNSRTEATVDSSTLDYDSLSKDEARKILTPSAFQINPVLFGAPLAAPSKRAFALLIDFILIGILSDAPGELLAILISLTLIQLGSKKRAKLQGKKRGKRKAFMQWVGVATLAIVLLSVASENFLSESNENSIASTQPASSEEKSTISNTREAESNDTKAVSNANDAKPESKGSDNEEEGLFLTGFNWLKDSIKELGLSFGWAALYFTLATAVLNGQTLGKRIVSIRVLQLDGTPLSVWDSFGRYGGYAAGLATGFLGFLQVFWDPNKQAIHDRISSTIVIDVKLANTQNHPAKHAGLRSEK